MEGRIPPTGPALEGRIFTSLGFQPQVVMAGSDWPVNRTDRSDRTDQADQADFAPDYLRPGLAGRPPPGVETPGYSIPALPGRDLLGRQVYASPYAFEGGTGGSMLPGPCPRSSGKRRKRFLYLSLARVRCV